MMRRPNYGIDAPGVVAGLCTAGVAGIALGGAALLWPGMPAAGLWTHFGLWAGGCWLLTAGVMLWSSLHGKFIARDAMLDAISWRGDERVLDVGCGHGLMLIGAAKRLGTGKAVGVDIWQSKDQHANSAQATRENARLEGVAERVDLVDGDARRLPFEAQSFDVVVSSYAIHNIPDAAGRALAMAEVARVLKPGGRVSVIDILHTGAYAGALKQAGLRDVKVRWTIPLFSLPTRIVTAAKPGRAGGGKPTQGELHEQPQAA